jgi:hypothetical protein
MATLLVNYNKQTAQRTSHLVTCHCWPLESNNGTSRALMQQQYSYACVRYVRNDRTAIPLTSRLTGLVRLRHSSDSPIFQCLLSLSCARNGKLEVPVYFLKAKQGYKKAVPLHAMKALGGTGGIAPTHSRPQH